MLLTDLEFWGRLLGIVLVDLALAGDNALVIALAVRALPDRQKIHGQIWGSLGGIALRLVFIASVTFFLTVPLLQAAAGLLLLWIAMRLVHHKTKSQGHVGHGATLLESIRTIILADVVMSLDNILAISALAEGSYVLVVVGVSLSLPLVVWGSAILARLMDRYPSIIWLGGGILGFASGEMMLKDPVLRSWVGGPAGNPLYGLFPPALAAIVTVLGWWLSHGHRQPSATASETMPGPRIDSGRRSCLSLRHVDSDEYGFCPIRRAFSAKHLWGH